MKLKVEKTNDAKKVIHNYVKRLAIVYFAWSLIYFPIQVMNYYANGVTGLTLLLKVLRDFIFVGFKQYWYLLALIIGVVIVCMLKKIFNIRVVFVCCALLYTVCLLANGYYGIYLLVFEEAEMVRTFFGALARVLQTTRNGLFFAPIFIAIKKLLFI